MTRVLEAAGVVVIPFDFDNAKISGSSLWGGAPEAPVVFFNARDPVDRVRLTLAHELAHLILHSSGHIKEDAEIEANLFAGEFLMPAHTIAPELAGTFRLERAAALKSLWGVSIQALARRAKTLGFLSPENYRSVQIKLSSAGMRRVEPACGLEATRESPRLLSLLLEKHSQDLCYSDNDLLKFVGLSQEELYNRFARYPLEAPRFRIV